MNPKTRTSPKLPNSHARIAWVDNRPEPMPDLQRSAGQRKTRWARFPLKTSSGEVVAVRLEGQELWVAVRQPGTPRLTWRPAERVLNASQITRWVACGFRP